VPDEIPEIGDLVWVQSLDLHAARWIQLAYHRRNPLIVVPVPKNQQTTSDHRWVYFDGKTHLIPKRYLKILSKKNNHELR